MRLPAALVVVAACKPLPPAPNVALHRDTAAAPVDSTTAMLIVGIAGELFSDGLGAAIRIERQVTTRTAVGGELTIGRGEGDRDHPHIWMVAARGFGLATPAAHDWVALTYGAGLAWLSTGLVSATVHAGGAVSYPNDYGTPYLHLGLAPVVVLRAGDPLGDPTGPRSDEAPAPARSEVFWLADVGLVGVLGDTGQRLSVDLGWAGALVADELLIELSAADSQRVEP
ncbi:MAG: hypothetical protein IPL61_32835 [Myxococcales bacterium]|nr:hypothetical protein [Myxococcales bacterium]